MFKTVCGLCVETRAVATRTNVRVNVRAMTLGSTQAAWWVDPMNDQGGGTSLFPK
jgi:hypothetical protein